MSRTDTSVQKPLQIFPIESRGGVPTPPIEKAAYLSACIPDAPWAQIVQAELENSYRLKKALGHWEARNTYPTKAWVNPLVENLDSGARLSELLQRSDEVNIWLRAYHGPSFKILKTIATPSSIYRQSAGGLYFPQITIVE
jgi:hypothetical protein